MTPFWEETRLAATLYWRDVCPPGDGAEYVFPEEMGYYRAGRLKMEHDVFGCYGKTFAKYHTAFAHTGHDSGWYGPVPNEMEALQEYYFGLASSLPLYHVFDDEVPDWLMGDGKKFAWPQWTLQKQPLEDASVSVATLDGRVSDLPREAFEDFPYWYFVFLRTDEVDEVQQATPNLTSETIGEAERLFYKRWKTEYTTRKPMFDRVEEIYQAFWSRDSAPDPADNLVFWADFFGEETEEQVLHSIVDGRKYLLLHFQGMAFNRLFGLPPTFVVSEVFKEELADLKNYVNEVFILKSKVQPTTEETVATLNEKWIAEGYCPACQYKNPRPGVRHPMKLHMETDKHKRNMRVFLNLPDPQGKKYVALPQDLDPKVNEETRLNNLFSTTRYCPVCPFLKKNTKRKDVVRQYNIDKHIRQIGHERNMATYLQTWELQVDAGTWVEEGDSWFLPPKELMQLYPTLVVPKNPGWSKRPLPQKPEPAPELDAELPASEPEEDPLSDTASESFDDLRESSPFATIASRVAQRPRRHVNYASEEEEFWEKRDFYPYGGGPSDSEDDLVAPELSPPVPKPLPQPPVPPLDELSPPMPPLEEGEFYQPVQEPPLDDAGSLLAPAVYIPPAQVHLLMPPPPPRHGEATSILVPLVVALFLFTWASMN